jgi:hypothetical protein
MLSMLISDPPALAPSPRLLMNDHDACVPLCCICTRATWLWGGVPWGTYELGGTRLPAVSKLLAQHLHELEHGAFAVLLGLLRDEGDPFDAIDVA